MPSIVDEAQRLADQVEARGNGFSAATDEETPSSSPTIVSLSDVIPEQVTWLWDERIPQGKLTILDGDPGLGKSTVTLDWAARVSTGRGWPDGTGCDQGGVVILSAEDGLGDTIKPRLEAMGADCERIDALTAIADDDGERLPAIPADLGAIRKAIQKVDADLVIVDPLMAYLGDGTDSHKDQSIRRALAPLSTLAEETGAAVLVVRHLNKGAGGNALYRGGGSIGIIGAARAGFLVAADPEQRVLASTKNNLAKPSPSLSFHLEAASNGSSRVMWDGESTQTATTLLAVPTDSEAKSALDEAKDFLLDALANGPRESKEVQAEARDAGISVTGALRRAREALGVKPRPQGFRGPYIRELPLQRPPTGVQTPTVEQGVQSDKVLNRGDSCSTVGKSGLLDVERRRRNLPCQQCPFEPGGARPQTVRWDGGVMNEQGAYVWVCANNPSHRFFWPDEDLGKVPR